MAIFVKVFSKSPRFGELQAIEALPQFTFCTWLLAGQRNMGRMASFRLNMDSIFQVENPESAHAF